MSRCGYPHPVHAATCAAPTGSAHDHHFAMVDGAPVEWPNLDFRPPVARSDEAIEAFVKKQTCKLASGMREVDSLRRQAVARRTDPQTSWDAAVSLGDLTESQMAVYRILRDHGPLIDAEIEVHAKRLALRQSPSGLRTRRAELVAAGLVEWTGERRVKDDTGNESRVWAVREI